MTWTNYDDVLDQLQGAGFELHDIEVGVRKRVKVAGVSQKGWYALHEIKLDDGRYALVGAYGWWVGAEKFVENIKLRVDKAAVKLSHEQQAAIKARIADEKRKAEAARKATADKAAAEAARVWHKYVTDGQCDYLTRKQVAAHGVRFAPGAGTMAIPIRDASGKLWGLQIIRGKDRGQGKLEKEYFPKGMAKAGGFHLLGHVGPVVLVAEGYATGATLHQATGLPVAVAFDAGNLLAVAQGIRNAHKRRPTRLLICADDDYLTDGNPGVKAADNAALAVDGAVAVPQFAADREGKKFTDYNDLASLEGEAVVAAQIRARLDALGWNIPPAAPTGTPSGAGLQQQGGGETGCGNKAPLAALITIDDAADRFSLIYGSRGFLFDKHEHVIVHKADVLDIMPGRAWDQLKIHPAWSAVRKTEVGFDPAGTDPNIQCNLFGGWPTVPKAGNCQALLDLGEYLCMGEDNASAVWRWILCWLAYPIQHPGAKMKTALIIHGPQRTGKNLFYEAVMQIYGEYGRVIDQNRLESQFNTWMSRGLLFVCDEVVSRQELSHVKGILKHLVTGSNITINPKGLTEFDERNHANFIFISNEIKPLDLDWDDGRHVVIWTPEKMPKENYNIVAAEIANGGVAALHHYLLHLDLGDFAPDTPPPMTHAKRDLIERSLPPQITFIQEWKAGDISYDGGDKVLDFCPCLGADLFDVYIKWAARAKVQWPGDLSRFIGTLAKLPGWRAGRSVDTLDNLISRNRKTRKMVIPSPDDLAAAAKAGRLPRALDQGNQSQADWLTQCFFHFRDQKERL